jgi:hypothetical protein
MEKLVELFMDGLQQVGPDIPIVEETFAKYDDRIEEYMKKCDV